MISQCAEAKQYKLFIQVVTAVTNHDQFNKGHTWMDTWQKVANHKPDKLSQGAHNQTSYTRVQWENTLDKRGWRAPVREMLLRRTQGMQEHRETRDKRMQQDIPTLQEASWQA